MSLELFICLMTLFSLVAIGAPIAYSVLVASIFYLAAAGLDVALAGEKILQGLLNSFVLLAVPLFIISASIMNAGSISDRLLQFCVALVGRFRGGLGHVNVVSSLIFAGMSGSAVADAAGIGKVIIDMMTKDGRYSRGYAAAITAASATIGPIIPPSIPMVLYAVVSGQSIGALFMAGLVPGVIMGGVLMVMNAYISTKRGFALEEPVPAHEIPTYTFKAFPALLMPVILLLGIYSNGFVTPTEAAAVAAFYALILAAIFYRALSWRKLYEIFAESARSSASVGLLIGGAFVLNYIVLEEGIPQMISDALEGRDMSAITFLLIINVLVLILGAFLDATTIILVIVPIFIPTARALGIDLVHFGVIIVVNSMIGLITPPYGVLLFVINAITGIHLKEIIREIWPFIIVLIIALVVMTLVPDIVLFLPRLLGYQG